MFVLVFRGHRVLCVLCFKVLFLLLVLLALALATWLLLKLVGVVTARVEGVRRQGTASHEPRTATLLLLVVVHYILLY